MGKSSEQPWRDPGGAQVLRVAFADGRKGARRESLPARESNDDGVNPIDRNSFRGKAPDSGTCEFQVPSSKFQVSVDPLGPIYGTGP